MDMGFSDIDLLAADAAQDIENMFCKHWDGGRTQRVAAVQVRIIEVMNRFWEDRIRAAASIARSSGR